MGPVPFCLKKTKVELKEIDAQLNAHVGRLLLYLLQAGSDGERRRKRFRQPAMAGTVGDAGRRVAAPVGVDQPGGEDAQPRPVGLNAGGHVAAADAWGELDGGADRKSTRLNSSH